jgi:hypothetical protein
VIPKYKDISDLLDKGATVEALERIMELREATLELQEENLDLKVKVKKLEEKLEDNTKVEFDGVFYWEVSDTSKKFPFCQQCRDNSEKNIRLQFTHSDWWECKTCKNIFNASKNREKPNYTNYGL